MINKMKNNHEYKAVYILIKSKLVKKLTYFKTTAYLTKTQSLGM